VSRRETGRECRGIHAGEPDDEGKRMGAALSRRVRALFVVLAVPVWVAVSAPAGHADTTLTSCSPSEFADAVAAGGTVLFGVDCPNLVPDATTIVPS
jgi:hypothetical protein